MHILVALFMSTHQNCLLSESDVSRLVHPGGLGGADRRKWNTYPACGLSAHGVELNPHGSREDSAILASSLIDPRVAWM